MNFTLDLTSMIMLFLQLLVIFFVLNDLKNTERMERALLKYVRDGRLTEKQFIKYRELISDHSYKELKDLHMQECKPK
mgnify:CR=1 FL=1